MFRSLKTYKEYLIINYMKLQKRLSRAYKDKKYYKYILVIPEKLIKDAGLKEKDEIYGETLSKGILKLKRI